MRDIERKKRTSFLSASFSLLKDELLWLSRPNPAAAGHEEAVLAEAVANAATNVRTHTCRMMVP